MEKEEKESWLVVMYRIGRGWDDYGWERKDEESGEMKKMKKKFID